MTSNDSITFDNVMYQVYQIIEANEYTTENINKYQLPNKLEIQSHLDEKAINQSYNGLINILRNLRQVKQTDVIWLYMNRLILYILNFILNQYNWNPWQMFLEHLDAFMFWIERGYFLEAYEDLKPIYTNLMVALNIKEDGTSRKKRKVQHEFLPYYITCSKDIESMQLNCILKYQACVLNCIINMDSNIGFMVLKDKEFESIDGPFYMCKKLLKKDINNGKYIINAFSNLYAKLINNKLEQDGVSEDIIIFFQHYIQFYLLSHGNEHKYFHAVMITMEKHLLKQKDNQEIQMIYDFYDGQLKFLIQYQPKVIDYDYMEMFFIGYTISYIEKYPDSTLKCIDRIIAVLNKVLPEHCIQTVQTIFLRWWVYFVNNGILFLDNKDFGNNTKFNNTFKEYSKTLKGFRDQIALTPNDLNNYALILDKCMNIIFNSNTNLVKVKDNQYLAEWFDIIFEMTYEIINKCLQPGDCNVTSFKPHIINIFNTFYKLLNNHSNYPFYSIKNLQQVLNLYTDLMIQYQDKTKCKWMFTMMYNYAGQFYNLKKYNLAIQYFENSLKLKKSEQKQEHQEFIKLYQLLIKCYEDSKQHDKLLFNLINIFNYCPLLNFNPAFACIKDDNHLKLKYLDVYINYSLRLTNYNSFSITTNTRNIHLNNREYCFIRERELYLIKEHHSEDLYKSKKVIIDQLLEYYSSNQHPILYLNTLLSQCQMELLNWKVSCVKVTSSQSPLVNINNDHTVPYFENFIKYSNISDFKMDDNIQHILIKIKANFHMLKFQHNFQIGKFDIQEFNLAVNYFNQFYNNLKESETIHTDVLDIEKYGDLDSDYFLIKQIMKLCNLLKLNQQFVQLGILLKKLVNYLSSKYNKAEESIELLLILSKVQLPIKIKKPLKIIDLYKKCKDCIKFTSDKEVYSLYMRIASIQVNYQQNKYEDIKKELVNMNKLSQFFNKIKERNKVKVLLHILPIYYKIYFLEGEFNNVIKLIEELNNFCYSVICKLLIKSPFNIKDPNLMDGMKFIKVLTKLFEVDIIEIFLNNYFYSGFSHYELGMVKNADNDVTLGLELSKNLNLLIISNKYYIQKVFINNSLHRFKEAEKLISQLEINVKAPNLKKTMDDELRLLLPLYYSAKVQYQYMIKDNKILELDEVVSIFNEILNENTTSILNKFIKGYILNNLIQIVSIYYKNHLFDKAEQFIKINNINSNNQLLNNYPKVLSNLNHSEIIKFLLLISYDTSYNDIFNSGWSFPVPCNDKNNKLTKFIALESIQKFINIDDVMERMKQHFIRNTNKLNGYELSLEYKDYALMYALKGLNSKSGNRHVTPNESCQWISYLLDMTNLANIKPIIIDKLKNYLIGNNNTFNQPIWPQFELNSHQIKILELQKKDQAISHRLKYYQQEFNYNPKDYYLSILKYLPNNWRVCSIHFLPETSDLYITRYDPNLNFPMIVRVSAFKDYFKFIHNSNKDQYNDNEQYFLKYMDSLKQIIIENTEISKSGKNCITNEQKKAWWDKRRLLNFKMRELLESFQNEFIRGIISIFLPFSKSQQKIYDYLEEVQNELNRIIHEDSNYQHVDLKLDVNAFKMTLALGSNLSKQFFIDHLELWLKGLGSEGKEIKLNYHGIEELYYVVKTLIQKFYEETNEKDPNFELDYEKDHQKLKQKKKDKVIEEDDSHLILILDKYTQAFPWESLPMLGEMSISRLPCLSFLRDRLITIADSQDFKKREGKYFINQNNGYYILNPENNLDKTQASFKESLLRSGWEGEIGKKPIEKVALKEIQEKDIYLYIGHGSGESTVRNKHLKRFQKCATSLLFGCSSGLLNYEGEYDLNGPVLQYLLAGSPSIVANLWDVTDRDIDKLSLRLLDRWGVQPFITSDKQNTSLSMAIVEARENCIFKYLTGAATVLYGIPSYLKKS